MTSAISVVPANEARWENLQTIFGTARSGLQVPVPALQAALARSRRTPRKRLQIVVSAVHVLTAYCVAGLVSVLRRWLLRRVPGMQRGGGGVIFSFDGAVEAALRVMAAAPAR